MARWLRAPRRRVRVWDSRARAAAARRRWREHVPDAELVCAATLGADALDGVDRVLKSPGLAPHDAAHRARCSPPPPRRGIPVQGELDLFARGARGACAPSATTRRKVIAITGTNGKTTTTALTALLVERSGQRVAVAGNIGPTMLQTLADALDAGPAETLRERLPEVWVLELSSFQLDGARRLRGRRRRAAQPHPGPPRLARLDGRLRGGQGAHLRPARDRRRQPRRPGGDAAACRRRRTVPTQQGPAAASRRRAASSSFGAGAPRAAGRLRPGVENDMAWLVRARDERRRARASSTVQHLMPADALRMRGRHNALNALAALALATPSAARSRRCCTACASTAASRTASSTSPAIDGVDAFDDSKGTNVGATVAALDRPRRRARAGPSWSSSSAATARARTSRRWPSRWRATRARWC